MNEQQADAAPPPRKHFFQSEDWQAVLLGGLIIAVALAATYLGRADDLPTIEKEIAGLQSELATYREQHVGDSAEGIRDEIKAREDALKKKSGALFRNPLKSWLGKVGEWENEPINAFFKIETVDGVKKRTDFLGAGIVGVFIFSAVVFSLGQLLERKSLVRFLPAYLCIFALAVIAYVLAGQAVIKYYNLEYVLWALLIGLVISNTIGTPEFLKPAMRTELFIKTGLVLLGAEILWGVLVVLGLPGIFVSWVVTPIVLITTYLFGQYILKIESRSLNMVISADMSVCGVSAAIATGAACRAKKEELSLAIGLSLAFTVLMMLVMPPFIKAVGMSDVLAGAWLGGTIDSTGAVAAAGALVSKPAMEVAATVKMIQNILIGAVALAVSVYWVTFIEKGDGGTRLGVTEIWRRFPKFVLGFVAASLLFSWIYSSGISGKALAESTQNGATVPLRGWFFCLAFVSIGLESNFQELGKYMKGGKPLVLYVCGQALNLVLTLLMAWLMFEKVFPQAAESLAR